MRKSEDFIGLIHCDDDIAKFADMPFLQKFGDLESGRNYDPSTLWLVVETTVLIIIPVLISFVTKSVMVLWGITGSTVSFFISFTLPAVFYLKVRWHKGYRMRNVIAFTMAVMSTFGIVLCTWQAIKHMDIEPCPTQP